MALFSNPFGSYSEPVSTSSTIAERRAWLADRIAGRKGWVSLSTTMQGELAAWTGDVQTTASLFRADRLDVNGLARELAFVVDGQTIAAAKQAAGV